MERAALLNLIHASEQEHQSYIEALGFDPYRTPRYEAKAKAAPADVLDQGCEAGSRAAQLRGILERHDETITRNR